MIGSLGGGACIIAITRFLLTGFVGLPFVNRSGILLLVEARGFSVFIPSSLISRGAYEMVNAPKQIKRMGKMVFCNMFDKISEGDSQCGFWISFKVFDTLLLPGKFLRLVMVGLWCQPSDHRKEVDKVLVESLKRRANLGVRRIYNLFHESILPESQFRGVEGEDFQLFSLFFRSLSGDFLCFKVKEEDFVVSIIVHIHKYIGILMGAFKLLYEVRMLKMKSDLKASSIKKHASTSLVASL